MFCKNCIEYKDGRCALYDIAVKRVVSCEEYAEKRPEEGYWDDDWDDNDE